MISFTLLVKIQLIIIAVTAFARTSIAHEIGPSLSSGKLGESVTFSQVNPDLSLEDAIFLGLRNNRSIRGAYLDRIAEKFDLRVERDRFRPKLVLSTRHIASRNQNDEYQRTDIIPQTELITVYGTRFSLSWSNQLTAANEAGQSRSDGATLSIVQPLLRGAGRDIATAPLRRAELSEKINLLNIRSTVSTTVNEIIIAYREILRAQESVQIATDALGRSRALLDANKVMIQSGRMAEFDIVQTEADVATRELAVEEARSQLAGSKLTLLGLLELDLNTQFQATDKLTAEQLKIDSALALRTATQSAPSYLTQLLVVQQAEIDLLVAKNSKLWDLSLVGGASQFRDRYNIDGGPSSNRAWEGYLGVQLDIPVGDISTRQAETRSQVNLEKQELTVLEARQTLEQDVANGVRDLDTRWRQYEIALRALELSRRKLSIENEKLQAGRSSNFQVLAFENDLRSAENARLSAIISYLNTQATLDLTLGTTLNSWGIEIVD